jgi:phospholipid transport system substrate-binding protein
MFFALQRPFATHSALAYVLSLFVILGQPATVQAAADDNGAYLSDDPHEVVQRASNDLIALIHEAQGYYDEDPDRFYTAVTNLLDPIVDFEGFSRGVLGPQYARRASPEQRREFSATFKRSLVDNYARALLQFDNEEIRVLRDDRPPRDENRREVNMELRTKDGRTFPVSYSMARNSDGRWQVRNIIVNGVNIGLTYRRQFESAMRSPQYGGDLDKVIADWGDKVAEIEVPVEEDS